MPSEDAEVVVVVVEFAARADLEVAAEEDEEEDAICRKFAEETGLGAFSGGPADAERPVEEEEEEVAAALTAAAAVVIVVDATEKFLDAKEDEEEDEEWSKSVGFLR